MDLLYHSCRFIWRCLSARSPHLIQYPIMPPYLHFYLIIAKVFNFCWWFWRMGVRILLFGWHFMVSLKYIIIASIPIVYKHSLTSCSTVSTSIHHSWAHRGSSMNGWFWPMCVHTWVHIIVRMPFQGPTHGNISALGPHQFLTSTQSLVMVQLPPQITTHGLSHFRSD